jgi:hypothetical protein
VKPSLVGLLRAQDKKEGNGKKRKNGKTLNTLDALQQHKPKWLQGVYNKGSGTKSGVGGVKKDEKKG